VRDLPGRSRRELQQAAEGGTVRRAGRRRVDVQGGRQVAPAQQLAALQLSRGNPGAKDQDVVVLLSPSLGPSDATRMVGDCSTTDKTA
jgi:hypothetical protein